MDKRKFRPGGGWSFFWFVLIVGIILALLNITAGVGATVRIPSTTWNLSLGGSIGQKAKAPQVIPAYLRNQVGDNNTFFNQSHTMTIWVAEGMGIIVLGQQPGVPQVDLTFNLRR